MSLKIILSLHYIFLKDLLDFLLIHSEYIVYCFLIDKVLSEVMHINNVLSLYDVLNYEFLNVQDKGIDKSLRIYRG
jgi:hypothetical protein